MFIIKLILLSLFTRLHYSSFLINLVSMHIQFKIIINKIAFLYFYLLFFENIFSRLLELLMLQYFDLSCNNIEVLQTYNQFII